MQQKFDYLVKLVILGDSAVGKTNILLRFSETQYKATHLPTIGVDFKVKMFDVDCKRLKLQLWDTAGQQRFRTITQSYYRGASGIVLVYSVADRSSFNNISNWISQIHEETMPKILVGNKSDVSSLERVVSREEGQQMAERFRIPFFETSAKDNININEIFQALTRIVLTRIQESTTPTLKEPTRRLEDGEVSNLQKVRSKCCM